MDYSSSRCYNLALSFGGPMSKKSRATVSGGSGTGNRSVSWLDANKVILGWCLLMLVLVASVYSSPSLITGKTSLMGYDYIQLHSHRMEYVRDCMKKGLGIPGWYTRQLAGTPFWSNIHNFPLIPTRLVLFLFDQSNAYAIGILLAALLSALFTFMFARKCGQSPFSAAIAGWTFACAGFFSARISAGHLVFLEAYPALPLLLLLCETELQREKEAPVRPGRALLLAFASACLALAGHPQLPFYAFVTAGAFIIWRERSKKSVVLLSSMAAGILSTMFVWWPFLKLAGRSSRTLALSVAENDIAMPLGRLKALVLPWSDGWPPIVEKAGNNPFHGYPTHAYFYDTVCYMGLVPLAALIILAVGVFLWGKKPGRTGLFLTIAGTASFVTSLTIFQGLFRLVPWTVLRSPSRQLYITIFCVCIALGAAFDLLLRSGGKKTRPIAIAAVSCLAVFQLFDLGSHAKCFMRQWPYGVGLEVPSLSEFLDRELKDGRVGIDITIPLAMNKRYDDAGFFDSIALASSYDSISRLACLPEGSNLEHIDAAAMPASALAKLAVKYTINPVQRDDLVLIGTLSGTPGFFHMVPNPSPRVSLDNDGREPGVPSAPVEYSRPSPDIMLIKTGSPSEGTLRIIEAWDIGWSAFVDGSRVPIEKLDGFIMGVKVPGGPHTVRLEFHTPGVLAGWLLSLLGPLLLGVIFLPDIKNWLRKAER